MARRALAHRPGDAAVADHLRAVLTGHRGTPLAGYLPMRSEIDPLPAMAEAALHGPVGVPVIAGPGLALGFARWSPDAPLVPGGFGTRIPAQAVPLTPRILIVPLLAFDAAGGRLGYGGGFYDRTLAVLRQAGPVLAIGYAYAAQEVDAVPLDATDQPLDMVVTDRDVRTFPRESAASRQNPVASGRRTP